MSRRYADQIVVSAEGTADGIYPTEFSWRGERYRVRSVLARWIETSPWWRDSSYRQSSGQQSDERLVGERLIGERLVWRVEAGRSSARRGVYDLCHVSGGRLRKEDSEPDRGQRWFLVRAFD